MNAPALHPSEMPLAAEMARWLRAHPNCTPACASRRKVAAGEARPACDCGFDRLVADLSGGAE